MTEHTPTIRIEGNISLPKESNIRDFENHFYVEFLDKWEYNFAGSITDVDTSLYTLILKETLQELRDEIQSKNYIIEHLQGEKSKHNEEILKLVNEYSKNLQQLTKSRDSYNRVVEELTKEREETDRLKSENALLLKNFKEKTKNSNVFDRFWRWFKSLINK